MRKLTMLLSGIIMVLALHAQAAEMQHDAHGMMTEMDAQSAVIHGVGVVKTIDKQQKKITIAHEAIAEIGWPAMTMRFTYREPTAAIAQLTEGSAVNFSFIQQGNISLLQDIETR